MIWQDTVLMVGGFIFSIALIPSVRSKNKPAVSTSLLTGGVLTAYIICYATMGFWLACSSGLLTAVMWFVLAIQRKRQK